MKYQIHEVMSDGGTQLIFETDRFSAAVLVQAMQLQARKAKDYQKDESTVKQADYYRRGVDTIYDEVWKKVLRIQSVLHDYDETNPQNFESVYDSCLDAINYLSFLGAYMSGRIDGQDVTRDIFNRSKSLPVGEAWGNHEGK